MLKEQRFKERHALACLACARARGGLGRSQQVGHFRAGSCLAAGACNVREQQRVHWRLGVAARPLSAQQGQQLPQAGQGCLPHSAGCPLLLGILQTG